MAPELGKNEKSEQADIYSLGCIFYEMLSQKCLFLPEQADEKKKLQKLYVKSDLGKGALSVLT